MFKAVCSQSFYST